MARQKRHKVVYLRADTLEVHPEAQRRFVPAIFNKIVKGLDLDALGTIHVVLVAGRYYIIDGQHRHAALMHRGLGEWQLACVLHENVTTHERAAQLFKTLNTRATVAAFDLFVVEVVAGDPIAVGTKAIAERHGLKVDRQARDGHICCVSAMRSIGGRSLTLFDETLRVSLGAWGATSAAVEGKLLEGLARFLDSHNGAVDRAQFMKKLAKFPGGASAFLGKAKGRAELDRASLPAAVKTQAEKLMRLA